MLTKHVSVSVLISILAQDVSQELNDSSTKKPALLTCLLNRNLSSPLCQYKQ